MLEYELRQRTTAGPIVWQKVSSPCSYGLFEIPLGLRVLLPVNARGLQYRSSLPHDLSQSTPAASHLESAVLGCTLLLLYLTPHL